MKYTYYEIQNMLAKGTRLEEIEFRVVSYARVSTDSKDQVNSLENQVGYFSDLIEKHKKWTFVGTYIDEGLSGTSTKKRKAFNRMIQDANRGKFDLIITKEISRFARNTVDTLDYAQKLLLGNVGIWFVNDNIITFDKDCEVRLGIMASLAQDESRRISQRVEFGFKRSISQGRLVGSAPIGYEKYLMEDGIAAYKVIPHEAECVKRIFELYCEGIGTSKIGKYIEKEGYLSRAGKTYSASTIAGIIKNPKYKGVYAGGKYKKVNYKDWRQVKTDPSTWNVIKDHERIPRIVSEELWDKANNIYSRRSAASKDNAKPKIGEYLYSGKIICAEHNRLFYRSFDKRVGEYWTCRGMMDKGEYGCDSPSFRVDELNEVFKYIFDDLKGDWGELVKTVKDMVKDAFEQLLDAKSGDDAEMERSKVVAKKQRLLDLLLENVIDREAYEIKAKALNDRLVEIDGRLMSIAEINSAKEDMDNNLKYIERKLNDYAIAEVPDDVFESTLKEILEVMRVAKTAHRNEYVLDVFLKRNDTPAHDSPTRSLAKHFEFEDDVQPIAEYYANVCRARGGNGRTASMLKIRVMVS